MDSPHLMKIFGSLEDKNYKYLVCEYCDGGNLLTLQQKQTNQVFTLEKAT